MESREEAKPVGSKTIVFGNLNSEVFVEKLKQDQRAIWWLIRESSTKQLGLRMFTGKGLSKEAYDDLCANPDKLISYQQKVIQDYRIVYSKGEWRTLPSGESPPPAPAQSILNSEDAVKALDRYLKKRNDSLYPANAVFPLQSEGSKIFTDYELKTMGILNRMHQLGRVQAQLIKMSKSKEPIQEKKFEEWLKNNSEQLGINPEEIIVSPIVQNPTEEDLNLLADYQLNFGHCERIFRDLSPKNEKSEKQKEKHPPRTAHVTEAEERLFAQQRWSELPKDIRSGIKEKNQSDEEFDSARKIWSYSDVNARQSIVRDAFFKNQPKWPPKEVVQSEQMLCPDVETGHFWWEGQRFSLKEALAHYADDGEDVKLNELKKQFY